MKYTLTYGRLRELVEYFPETGVFVHKITRGRAVAGEVAGVKRKDGYILLCLDNEKILAHRVAWFYMNGEWPAEVIDHINGNPRDNRIANLRPATYWQNSANSGLRSTNKSGFKGVSWVKEKKKWTARLMVNSRFHNLGYFDSKEEAGLAYKAAIATHAGEFARTEHDRVN